MKPVRQCVVGVDFDNTLITYDDLLHTVAVQQELIEPIVDKSKKGVRNQIRRLPNGEIIWRRLQALAYGSRISEARLIDGVRTFFEHCKRLNVTVYIVSHKTEFSRYDETRTNLREAALGWMAANQFFHADGLGLSSDTVFFSGTRREKVARIRQLGCTHFIDDLEETFQEDTFPAGVEKILYTRQRPRADLPGVKVMTTWEGICGYFFEQRT